MERKICTDDCSRECSCETSQKEKELEEDLVVLRNYYCRLCEKHNEAYDLFHKERTRRKRADRLILSLEKELKELRGDENSS